jgi:hypothetical protein
MRRLQLSRRALLRGAGSVAIALPWLEVMEPLKSSRAAEVPARRFVAVYTPGGTVLENWSVPVGPLATLSPILTPLGGVADKLTVVQGLSMKCAVGEQQQAGMIGLLTGCSQERSGQAVPNASLDLELAALFGQPVLYQAVRWATGAQDGGQPSVTNTVSYHQGGTTFELNQPAIDPQATWESLFGALPPGVDVAWKKSILDSVLGRYNKLAQQLGKADRQRLEQHAELLRSIEKEVQASCKPPTLVDTADYQPAAGAAQDLATDAAIPKVGKLMMDMLVAALSCNLTNVATLQWADSRAAYTLPWLDLPGGEVQNYYEGNGGFDSVSMTKIFTWYSTQHAYLLEQMASIDLGGHSLLDESVVFFGSQLQNPATHVKSDMPFLLAGGGGGLQGGRALSYPGYSHNDLLLSILRLFGDTRPTFGDASFCAGVLAGL